MNRGLHSIVIDQGAAGTTQLVEATPYFQITVINYVVVMAASGTFAFSDGTDWLSGDMEVDEKGGVSARGGVDEPLMVGGLHRPLQITTTGGAASGHCLIRVV